MITYIAETQPAFLGGEWVAISRYSTPRSLQQAMDDVTLALAQDKSPTPSPKRIVCFDGSKSTVIWSSVKQSPSSSSSSK